MTLLDAHRAEIVRLETALAESRERERALRSYAKLAVQIYDAGAIQDAALAKEMARLLRDALAETPEKE